MAQRSPQMPAGTAEVLHAAETGIGGINTVILGLGERQVERFGPERVHVLVPRNHAADFAGTALVTHVFERDARGLRALLGFSLSLARLVLTLKPSFVILHSSFAGLAGRLVLLALRPVRRPVVIYCAHGWAFTMAVSERRKRLFAAVERRLAPLASAIVNISEAEHEAALSAGLPPERLHFIQNGTPRASAEPGGSPYPDRPGRLTLLFVGRLDKQKGFDLLAAALAENPHLPIDVVVVGRPVAGPVTVPHVPNVTYVGWLRREDLAPYYAHADAVAVPSRWEGYGLVAAEALSYGTPVIASRVGGLATLVEDGVSGFLFDPDVPDALVAILSKLDRARLRGMRPAALRRWKQVADLQVMEGRYFKLMQSLAAEGHHVQASEVGLETLRRGRDATG
jgi:glycosyltransferase involved in cell wall biosynthesis